MGPIDAVDADCTGNSAVSPNRIIEGDAALELDLRELRVAPCVGRRARRIDPRQPFAQARAVAADDAEDFVGIGRMAWYETELTVDVGGTLRDHSSGRARCRNVVTATIFG